MIGARGVNLIEHRLYDMGYPPLRGTFLQTSARNGVLYTKGSVPFFETYPGMYVPKPFALKIGAGDQTPLGQAREVLALTKMNCGECAETLFGQSAD